ncbi:hypothetical protein HK101_003734, partial [Irineochytrium annulatum]
AGGAGGANAAAVLAGAVAGAMAGANAAAGVAKVSGRIMMGEEVGRKASTPVSETDGIFEPSDVAGGRPDDDALPGGVGAGSTSSSGLSGGSMGSSGGSGSGSSGSGSGSGSDEGGGSGGDSGGGGRKKMRVGGDADMDTVEETSNVKIRMMAPTSSMV